MSTDGEVPVGTNTKVEIVGDQLTITVDLSAPRHRSQTGKTMIIATTGGGQSVPGHDDPQLKINLSVWDKKGM